MKRKILNKRNVVLSSVGLAMISGAGVFAYNVNQPVAPLVSVVEEKEPEVASIEQVEKVELKEPKLEVAEQTVPPTVQPVQQPEPVVETQEVTEPVVYKWAAEMAEAGVAESEYGYITDMVLNEHGWREYRHDPSAKLWQRSGMCNPREYGLAQCIKSAVHWSVTHYGSIKNAHDAWVRNSDF